MYLVQCSDHSNAIFQLMILKSVPESINLIAETAKRETFFQVVLYYLPALNIVSRFLYIYIFLLGYNVGKLFKVYII